ncbi:MAG: DUF4286 family protein [Aureispira sp.]|nr:DUF4286 family protein [Aureispira sp.]
MILYNVTVKIDTEVHEDWLHWMKTVHIPDVMATGFFKGHQIAKVLGQDEADGFTYAIQYTCPDMKTLHQYTIHHAPALQQDHSNKYEGKFVAFRTLLEVVG